MRQGNSDEIIDETSIKNARILLHFLLYQKVKTLSDRCKGSYGLTS